jgi:hypothetical protein
MNTKKKIYGKVSRVLNTRELVLNIGQEHGVEIDMLFDIFPKSRDDITDPDTDEALGSIYRPKVRVRVTNVEQRFSISRTYQTKGGSFSPWASLANSALRAQRYETLKQSDAKFEDLDEADSYVKRGDPAEQVVSIEDAGTTIP